MRSWKKIESPCGASWTSVIEGRPNWTRLPRVTWFWQITHISLINGKIVSDVSRTGASFARWADARRLGFFFIYFCRFKHVVCDYGKAKIWVGETWTALVFVLLFFSFPRFFFLFSVFIFAQLERAKTWNVDKRTIFWYRCAIESIFLLEQRRNQERFNITRD